MIDAELKSIRMDLKELNSRLKELSNRVNSYKEEWFMALREHQSKHDTLSTAFRTYKQKQGSWKRYTHPIGETLIYVGRKLVKD